MKPETLLSQLKRCQRWVEDKREHGFIYLHGITPSGLQRSEILDEKLMLELLKDGKLEMDTSQRIAQDPYAGYFGRKAEAEVAQRYWRVLS